jgi:hypothetical protein
MQADANIEAWPSTNIDIMAKRLSEYETQIAPTLINCSFPVFVTGNPNKLKEVRAILSDGGHPIDIDSRSLDSKYLFPLLRSAVK